jgi:hypothetical protein
MDIFRDVDATTRRGRSGRHVVRDAILFVCGLHRAELVALRKEYTQIRKGAGLDACFVAREAGLRSLILVYLRA